MKRRIAINGFGRIGRAAFRIMLEREDCEVVAINDLTDNETLAHLLQFDTMYRTLPHDVTATDDAIVVDGTSFPAMAEPEPAKLPWKDLAVDVVLECTGRFVKDGAAQAHLDAGAKQVVLSAPAKGEGDVQTFLRGVNDQDCSDCTPIVSNASCTTNCITPVVAVMDREFGIDKAMMTTIHSYTATQNLQDGPHKDLRLARAAAQNMIPASTGAAIATTKVLPQLEGKFDGMAVRVPTITVSLSDLTFVLDKETTEEEVNAALTKASESDDMKGVLGVTDKPVVSSDFIGDTRSSIVDLSLTKMLGGNFVKVIAWYDNEWGYANRLVELSCKVGLKN